MDQRDRAISRRQALSLGIGALVAVTSGCAPGQSPAAPGTSAPAPDSPSAPPDLTPQAGPRTHAPAVQIIRGSGARPEVALTFHGAGPVSITKQVLAALAAGHAKATVLAVGTWLAASPDGIRMVRDGGHEIGNHTWSHVDMTALSAAAIQGEIERCRDRLDSLVGTPGDFFRQSAARTATQRELVVAGQAGYPRVLSYDIDSLDWQDPPPAAIRAAVARATAGSVVSMHLGHAGTVLALPGILNDLANRGLTPVTASELLR